LRRISPPLRDDHDVQFYLRDTFLDPLRVRLDVDVRISLHRPLQDWRQSRFEDSFQFQNHGPRVKSPQLLPDLSFWRLSEYAFHLPRNSRECENYRPSCLEADSRGRPRRVLERGRPPGESRHLPPHRGELQVAPPHPNVVAPDHPQRFPIHSHSPSYPFSHPLNNK